MSCPKNHDVCQDGAQDISCDIHPSHEGTQPLNRRPLLEFLITATTPPPEPECQITYFTEIDDGCDGFTIECRELSCGAGRDDDGSWNLSFTIWVTTTMPFGPIVTKRKVPSTTLQENLLTIVGIETRFDSEPIYQSLIGLLPCRPDPDELLEKMQMLMATVELSLLYAEPSDEEEEDAEFY